MDYLIKLRIEKLKQDLEKCICHNEQLNLMIELLENSNEFQKEFWREQIDKKIGGL